MMTSFIEQESGCQAKENSVQQITVQPSTKEAQLYLKHSLAELNVPVIVGKKIIARLHFIDAEKATL